MKFRILGIVTILACCVLGIACVTVQSPPVASRQPRVEMPVASGPEDEPFYDDLADYGEWVHVKGPGWVWSPYNTPAGWRPYQLGHWVYTDYGWTWASDEDYGWAVYHYGRWSNHPAYGWVWSPGTEWGPAWVAWNEGGGWVGWAPLPWQVSWRAGIGLDWGGVNVNVALGPSNWYFVQARHMVAPDLRYRVAPASRNVTLVNITQHVTNYIYVDNRIVDRSVTVEKIGRAVGHTIPRYRVRPADSPGSAPGGKVRGQEFVVFRPSPMRGAKSQGRVVPPGHDGGRPPADRGRHSGGSDEASKSGAGGEPNRPIDRGRHAWRPEETASEEPEAEPSRPVNRGRHAGRSDEAANAEPGEAASSDGDSVQPSARTKQRPSRHPSRTEPERTRAPHQPPAEAPPQTDDSPDQEAPLATPAENRPNRQPAGDRRRSAAPSSPSQSDHPSSGERGNAAAPSDKPASANPPSEKPRQGTALPPKPEQAKGQPVKSKGKKPADAVSKPDKPKPDGKNPKESNSEESKSEDSEDRN
ncbi:MAG: hypothetical protein L0Z52_06415 [Acidobacteria bacterium]|nr:hypothetical protein [Acidobacteriota bacterium]